MPNTKTKRRYGAGSVSRYTNTTKAGKVTKWRWMLWVPADPSEPNGPQKRLTGGGFRTAAEAEEALQLKRAELRENRGAPSPEAAAVTLGDYATEWVDGLTEQVPSTIAGYRKILRNHVLPQLGTTDLKDVTAKTLAKHYRDLLEGGRRDTKAHGAGLSPNTVAKVHNVLSAILDAAMNDGLTRQNVAKLKEAKPPTAKRIKAAKPELTTWTPEELRGFLVWNRDEVGDDLNTMWQILAYTGLRRGEVVALRWSDLDEGNQRLAVRRAADDENPGQVKSPKSGKARVVDLREADVTALLEWKALRRSISRDFVTPGAYIFGNNTDGSLRDTDNLTRRWSLQVRKAQAGPFPDLPYLYMHGLRHTHCTHLLQAGVQPKVVQERAGHATIQITIDTYSHVMPSMQRDAVARLSML